MVLLRRRDCAGGTGPAVDAPSVDVPGPVVARSEEHTSELQSQSNLVCRLLLEKKKKNCLDAGPHAAEFPGWWRDPRAHGGAARGMLRQHVRALRPCLASHAARGRLSGGAGRPA